MADSAIFFMIIYIFTGIGNFNSPIYSFANPNPDKGRVLLIMETVLIPFLLGLFLLYLFKDGSIWLPLCGFVYYQIGRFSARLEYEKKSF
jgi:hypothetical protein